MPAEGNDSDQATLAGWLLFCIASIPPSAPPLRGYGVSGTQ